VVAVRDTGTNAVTYLHNDHLGSAGVATDAAQVKTQQEFDPWGKLRSGAITQTNINYTGQRLDGTGLLYYHARMYDPNLGRFVSADSVVPGSASGSMDGVALKPLTVDFHEPGFVSSLNGENQQGFWFQMSEEDRKNAGNPWGPQNPQALNRYTYVQNKPLKYTDPSGHAADDGKVDKIGGVSDGAAGGGSRFPSRIQYKLRFTQGGRTQQGWQELVEHKGHNASPDLLVRNEIEQGVLKDCSPASIRSRLLYHLEKQAARKGIDTPPEIQIELQELRAMEPDYFELTDFIRQYGYDYLR
jgi:RHS repeat-associated protein